MSEDEKAKAEAMRGLSPEEIARLQGPGQQNCSREQLLRHVYGCLPIREDPESWWRPELRKRQASKAGE